MDGNSATTTLSWEAESVDVAMIECQLARLWQEATATGSAEHAPAITRNSVLNLVIVTPDAAKGQQITDTLNHISDVHPSRVLTIVERRRRVKPGYDAALSIYAQADPSGTWQALRDEIYITARGAAADHLLGMVVPLLIPGLPVYLWWIGEPPLGGPLFAQMVEISDRIIIDSAQFYDGAAALPALVPLINTHGGRCIFSDLNWARLTQWRELTAQFFDAPHVLPCLYELHSLTLEYAIPADGGRPNATQALLLIGWLASLLSWQIVEARVSPSLDNALYIRFTAPNGTTISAEVHGRASLDAPASNLLSTTISAQHHRHDIRFQIRRLAEHQVETVTTLDSRETQRRTTHFEGATYAQLLRRELSLFTRDKLYERALEAAAKVMKETL